MKNILKIFGVIVFVFVSSLCLLACNKSIEEIISGQVSEYREDFFFASSDDGSVSFTDGQREIDFVTNGMPTKLVDFGVLVFKTDKDFGDSPKFKFLVNDKVYEGNFERNPFDNTYVVDLLVRVNSQDKLVFSMPEYGVNEITLQCLSKDWEISCSKALDIFCKNNSSKLQEYVDKDNFEGEIFIKIVADKKQPDNIYWYVLCVCQDGNVISNLISVTSGEIVQN